VAARVWQAGPRAVGRFTSASELTDSQVRSHALPKKAVPMRFVGLV
jgi:hypothetical protein